MGRPLEGFKIRKRPGERCWRAVFTAQGRQCERGTGEEDADRASVVAAQLYARAQRGELTTKRRRRVPVGPGTGESGAQWLNETAATRDPTTNDTYALYVSTHWAEFFPTVGDIGPQAQAYLRDRLKCVKGGTVRKELSALRQFVAWLVEKGYLPEAPTIPSVPKKAVGTPHKQGKRTHTDLSPREVQKLLRALPERSPRGWPIRARFVVMYETTLRPETLSLLSVPENYTKGSRWLRIRDSDDKARHARRVPLSAKARKALDAVCPKSGPIFGRHACRWHLDRAAHAALKPAKAETFHAYDLRSAGITHRLERGASLPGVQHLAGHQSVATTALYVRAGERAAEAAVRR